MMAAKYIPSSGVTHLTYSGDSYGWTFAFPAWWSVAQIARYVEELRELYGG